MLDLFFVTYRGPVFLWHENTQWLTLVVHFLIALSTTCVYWLVDERAKAKRKNKARAMLIAQSNYQTPCEANTQSDVNANSKMNKAK